MTTTLLCANPIQCKAHHQKSCAPPCIGNNRKMGAIPRPDNVDHQNRRTSRLSREAKFRLFIHVIRFPSSLFPDVLLVEVNRTKAIGVRKVSRRRSSVDFDFLGAEQKTQRERCYRFAPASIVSLGSISAVGSTETYFKRPAPSAAVRSLASYYILYLSTTTSTH